MLMLQIKENTVAINANFFDGRCGQMNDIERAIKYINHKLDIYRNDLLVKATHEDHIKRLLVRISDHEIILVALQAQAEREKECEWVQTDEDGGSWKCNECDFRWDFIDGDPFENDMKYCPKCGKPIKAIRFFNWDKYNGHGECIRVERKLGGDE